MLHRIGSCMALSSFYFLQILSQIDKLLTSQLPSFHLVQLAIISTVFMPNALKSVSILLENKTKRMLQTYKFLSGICGMQP